MRIRRLITYALTVAAVGGVSFPLFGQVTLHFGLQQQQQPPPPPQQYQQQQPQYQSNWNDDQKRELRHIYYRLEHATSGYDSHRENALREIRAAAEEMGMDLHGSGYAQQWQGSPGYGGYGQQPQGNYGQQYGQQPQSQEFSHEALQRWISRTTRATRSVVICSTRPMNSIWRYSLITK